MALDGITLHYLAEELREELLNLNIDKIQQSKRYDIIISFRKRGAAKLLLSARANMPICFLSNMKFDIPLEAPMFCMLLRKHLGGAKLVDIRTESFDRTIYFDFDIFDDFADLKRRTLVFELMGRQTNIILLNEENIILDSLIHVDFTMSRTREILPARPFVNLPVQDKPTPEARLQAIKDGDLQDLYDAFQDKTVEKALLSLARGISPQIVNEIIYRANLENLGKMKSIDYEQFLTLLPSIIEVLEEIAHANGRSYYYPFAKKGQADYHVMKLTHLGDLVETSSLNATVARVYEEINTYDQFSQKQQHLMTLINKDRSKKARLLEGLLSDIEKAENYEDNRLYGELILSQLHSLSKNYEHSDTIELMNYYLEEPSLITITIDPKYSIQENAKRFFKKYNKQKETLTYAVEKSIEIEADLTYLDSVISFLEQSNTIEDLQAIEEEVRTIMPENKVKKSKAKKSKQGKNQEEIPLPPRKYISSGGFTILAGRNNIQNDRLSLRQAKPHDLWLHAKDRAGAHVVIQSLGESVDEQSLLEAAEITAYLSRTRSEKENKMQVNIPIDYTEAKNVRKARGAKPGLVIYDGQQTIIAEAKAHLDLLQD